MLNPVTLENESFQTETKRKAQYKGYPFSFSHFLPHGYFDSQVTVDSDGQQGEDGTLREHQHGACDQQAAVEVRFEPDADGDGQRDDQSPHRNIRQSQRHYETEGGVPQRTVYPYRPDHHHVPDHRGHGDNHLHPDVEGLGRRQTRRHPVGCLAARLSGSVSTLERQDGEVLVFLYGIRGATGTLVYAWRSVLFDPS